MKIKSWKNYTNANLKILLGNEDWKCEKQTGLFLSIKKIILKEKILITFIYSLLVHFKIF